jgi:hypothetical protein
MSDDLKDFNPEETVIKLKFPIERTDANGVTSLINEIKLKRFKFKHIKLLPSGLMAAANKSKKLNGKKKVSEEEDFRLDLDIKEVGALIPLVSALSGLTEDEAGDIDFIDLLEVVGKLGMILGK